MTNFIICPRCEQEINTLEMWVQETKDGLTCVECLTKEEHENESGYTSSNNEQ